MRYKILLTIISIFVIAVFATLWATTSSTTLGQAQTVLTDEINKSLNGRLSFSRMEITGFTTVTFYDAKLEDDQGRVVALSEKVAVSLNATAILEGRADISSIRQINASAPAVNLTHDGSRGWNIERILKRPQEPSEAEFTGKVTIDNGKLTIDYKGKQRLIENISGELNYVHNPASTWQFTAAYNGNPVTIDGTVKGSGDIFLRLKAGLLPLADVADCLPADSRVAIHNGEAGDLSLTVRLVNGNLTYAGETALRHAGVDIDGVPVRDALGQVTFTHQSIYLYQATAKVYEQPVTVHGRIRLDTTEPFLALNVQSTEFDPAALGVMLPFSGKVAFQAVVSGPASNPTVSGDAQIGAGDVYGYTVEQGSAKLYLANKMLTISQAAVGVLGGQLSLSGTVDFASAMYQLNVSGDNLDISQIQNIPAKTSGRGNVQAILAGSLKEGKPHLTATLEMAGGQILGVAMDKVTAGLSGDNAGSIQFSYINGYNGESRLTAQGTYTGGNLDLTVNGSNIPLPIIAAQAGNLPLTGLIDLEGKLTGSLNNLTLDTTFTAKEGIAWAQPYQTATGRLSLTRNSLTLYQVQAKHNDATHVIEGTVQLGGDQSIDMKIATTGARAENIINLIMPGEELTGHVDNEVILTGPLRQFNAYGKFKLRDGSFRKQLVSSIDGKYHRLNGVTVLEDFVIHSLNTEIKMSGTISASNKLELDLAARDIDLAKFRLADDYTLAGQASFNGRLTGTADSPEFMGQLTSDKMVLNGQTITAVSGYVNSYGPNIHVPSFSFSQGEGKFEFTGGLNTETHAIYGDIQVENGHLGNLLQALASPVKDIDGKLSGQIEIGGTIHRPDMAVKGSLLAGQIKGYPLDQIEIDVSLKNNVLTVNNLFAKQGSGVLAIKGSADLNGPLKLEIGGRDIDAGLLTAWFDSTIDTKGKLTFSAEVGGTAAAPKVAVSLQISGGSVANASFDDLYGLFTVDRGSIQVNQVMLLKGPYKASAYGLIPLAALTKAGRAAATAADQMNLTVTLDKADLTILPLLTQEVAWATGETKGQVKIGGTLYQPLVTGQIAVANGTIKAKSLTNPIQNVSVDIQFEGDKINIKTFSGAMGSGTYSLTGSAGWQGLTFTDYDFSLALNRLGVEHRNFKGPLEGNLRLSGKSGKPYLTGKLLFENATIDIPYIPEISSSDLDMGIDLEVIAGKRVRLYNSYMYDITVEGKAKFGGSLKAPDASGHFQATRGTVSYLRTQFKIKDGSADFTRFGSFEPVIKLNASTKLEQTTVELAINGPVSAMEMRLESQPALSQQEILSLLTLRSRYFDKQKQGAAGQDGFGREELVGLLDAGLQMRFISEVESAFRNAFGVDEFRIVRGTLSEADASDRMVKDREVYNLEISKYVTDKLMLSYTLGVDHEEHSISFRYDINRFISITGSQDNQNRRLFGLETRFRF